VIRTRWRVAGKVGGPIEGGGTPSGYFTAATGIVIYRGNACPEDYRGDAFIADCGSNLVHRKRLIPKGAGLIARRPESEQKTEFLASRDNWFRPVQLANGPDGALYVIDMYREVIEHPWSLPEPIKKHLDLNSGNDRGRIYRIIPDDFEPPPAPRLDEAATPELVEVLAHSNGWHRNTAARLLYERQDADAVPHLEEMLQSSSSQWGRLHALAVLDGMNRLQDAHLLNALSDPAGPVREHGLRLTEIRRVQPDEILPAKWWEPFQTLAEDPDPRVRYQLALTLGFVLHPDKPALLAGMLRRHADDPWMRSALLNSLGREPVAVLDRLLEGKAFQREPIDREILPVLLRIIGARNQRQEVSAVLERLVRIKPADRVFPYLQALGEGLQEIGGTLAETAETNLLDPFFGLARRTASDSSASIRARQQAIQFLSQAPWEQVEDLLFSLLEPGTPEPVQGSAIDGLRQFAAPGIGSSLIERWDYLTPRLRSKAVEVLLRRPERVKALLNALKQGTVVPAELSAAQKEFLRQHNEPQLRRLAKGTLGDSTPAGSGETIEAFAEALELTGRPAQGKAIYEQRCASCHHLGDAGFNVGPDLATMKSGGKETLLTHILDPNRDVAPEYVNYQVVTTDGETLTGLITPETGSRLTLKNANGQITDIQRSRIERIRSLGQSLMPEGLAQDLSSQEMADLLAFVLGS
jgi:putative heme-binding domain-containing protein